MRVTPEGLRARQSGTPVAAARARAAAIDTPDDGVGSEPGFVIGAVELDQRTVELGQICERPSTDRLGNLAVDVRDRLEDALAPVAGSVPVTELDCFARAGRSARWHPGARDGAVAERHGDRQGRVAPGIENLDGFDACHVQVHLRISFRSNRSLSGRLATS